MLKTKFIPNIVYSIFYLFVILASWKSNHHIFELEQYNLDSGLFSQFHASMVPMLLYWYMLHYNDIHKAQLCESAFSKTQLL